MNANRYAIKETNCPDQAGGALYWNFTAWRADHPERLLDAADAERELARLRVSCPHAAGRMAIVDVVLARAKCKAAASVVRAAVEALGYDKLPKGPEKDAAAQVLRAVRAAAYAAVDAGAAAAAEAAAA